MPAHYCGVAALRPTVGRVPNTGALELPGGLTDPRSQVGPMSRRVEDLMEPILSSLAFGDAVMVKGSKGVRLASLVEQIKQRFSAAP